MSSTSAMDQAYRVFLSSSDLETWTTSLAAFRELIAEAENIHDARPVDIRHALTIAIYVAWLSLRCGEKERSSQVMMRFHDLSARSALVPQFGGAEGTLIQAVIAAAANYVATARRLIQDLAAPLPVEIALLMVPRRAAPKAAALKPFVLDGAGHRFVPAVYFYGSALLDLGYQSSAEELLERNREVEMSSLAIDLRGQLLELAGSWSEARDRYAKSEWASHAYRRAVCDLILGESIDQMSQWPAEAVNKFRAGMLDFSAETDRAGVLRSASFVRACRWKGFDNWLVHFELGRIGFQRRRHGEAERYLSAAAQAAPELFRFPIHSLRFCNLTWLGRLMDVAMDPEALEAGHAALREPASEEQKADVRTWIGGFDAAFGVLDPVLTSSDDYHRGIAHQIRGNIPDAIAYWCSCISKSYTPRAFHQLLHRFASYGFERTASRLAETVALESDESFFDVWELTGTIAEFLKGQPAGRVSGGFLQNQLVKLEARMEELVESEFQNAIRAFHHFLERRQPAAARRMLARADRLADGAEELLLLAIARRKAAAGGVDPRALDALHLAESQSTDRFERLLIAREFVTLGEVASARTILSEEGVFSGKQDLTPIEYVLALQCAKVCSETDEYKLLEAVARDALKRDIGAGRFPNHGQRFLSRLNAELSGGLLEIALPFGSDVCDIEISSWRELMNAIERFQRDRQGEQELSLLNDRVQALSVSGSPCSRLALWGVHLDRFEAHSRMIDRHRPSVDEDEIPLAHNLSVWRLRAQHVTRLWRDHLLATERSDADRQLAKIRAFLEEDKELTARWDRLRNADAEEPSKFALAYAKQGAVLLDDIGSDTETSALWPPFLDIPRALQEDARALAARLQERANFMSERVTQWDP